MNENSGFGSSANTPSSSNNPYAGLGAQHPQQPVSAPTYSQWEQDAGPVEPIPSTIAPAPKEKRKVGLGAALALMLVASVGTGVVTAVALNETGSTGTVYNSLEQAPAKREGAAQPGSVEEVANRVLPAVVSIQVSARNGSGEGSGSIISSDGLVLTNNHVVEDASSGGLIEVSLNDGSVHPADLIARDGSTDIAVIKIRDVSGLPTLKFGNSNDVAVGQEVVAVGSPLGLSATVTSGIVSALNRPVRASGGNGGESSLIDAIQTDAAINPGNSGGPLVDMQGNLVGMNSVIATLSEGPGAKSGSIGLGFAIPANQAKRIADQLVKTGEVRQPMIGVKVSQNSKYRGALVAGVEPDGPADKAGIVQGDLITKVNDRTIDTADALIAAVRSREFGETITLQVSEPDSRQTREVKLTLPQE
ncbi:trypsin-like peptidase domain-containing protein [Corynebacterium hindlerae]|uniref:S1C family serine protease n=1 Tax=Corynebacterium hindlerae TaxID=699041 RepID=UPI001AD7CFB4|nr:trypsin-like peptidase domain-containing protein [Corynebacterium hindlerae]QTH60555.1 trypsin-like peptidase domain-containing protein [Corynebacterium hindlerae]